jgi:hypothetical protein
MDDVVGIMSSILDQRRDSSLVKKQFLTKEETIINNKN